MQKKLIHSFICVKLPKRDLDPLAYDTITQHMIHDPCGLDIPRLPILKAQIVVSIIQNHFAMKHALKRMGLLNIGEEMMVEESLTMERSWIITGLLPTIVIYV